MTAADALSFAMSERPIEFVVFMIVSVLMGSLQVFILVDWCLLWRDDWSRFRRQYRARKAAEEKVAKLEKQIEELTKGPYRR